MLTVTNPEILPDLARLAGGLFPIRAEGRGGIVLAIKCSKETILAAKMNRGFKFYLAPVVAHDVQTYSLVTAFFDDQDEPLCIRSPLFDGKFTGKMCELLASDAFDVHFFDEHNRELLGYRARNEGAARFRARAQALRFLPVTHELARDFLAQMTGWFGRRTADDDNDALNIAYEETLFPENLVLLDIPRAAMVFHGSTGPEHTRLERDIEPGPFQERDIGKLLQRIFQSNEIYLNPLKAEDARELADVLVLTQKNVFFIQAKDSPNTEKTLRRPIERKRAVVLSHLRKAVAQLRGALSYSRSRSSLKITTNGLVHELSLEGRTRWGVIVVKELFDPDVETYSSPVLELARDAGMPCVVLDYIELHNYTLHLRTEDELVGAFRKMFEIAAQRGEYPRTRFGLVPPVESE